MLAADAPPAGLAIDAATRLEMLAERSAKIHAQVGQQVLAARSRRALGEALAEFERTLASVALTARADAREGYALARAVWSDYRRFASRPADRESARGLAERTEELAWIANKAARELRAQLGGSDATSLLFAASARTASQRLGKLYLLRDWAIAAKALEQPIASARAQYREAMAELEKTRGLSEGAALDLRVVESQFAFLEEAAVRLSVGKERARSLEHIAKSSDHIAEVLDRMARVFASA